MPDTRPNVSIIIATYNRRPFLREALFSLSRLDFPKDRYEIVVVDDGSTDGTEALLAAIGSSFPLPLRYIRREDHKGPSAARNAGIRVAEGDFLVFTDDDCLFEREWMTKLLAPLDSPAVGMVGGPDRSPEGSPFFETCEDYLMTSFVGTGGLRRGNKLRLGVYYPKSCNMAIRRDVIAHVGVFDENLLPGEDIELSYRVKKAGYVIKFAPDAFVWHKRKHNLTVLLRKIYRIGYGRVVLARKHRGLLDIAHMIPFLWVLALLLLGALSFFSSDALRALTFALVGYVVIVITGGVQAFYRMKDVRALLIVPFLIALQHTAHGLGFLVGAIDWATGSGARGPSGRPEGSGAVERGSV